MADVQNPPAHTPGPWAYRADRTIADAAGTPLARCYADRNEAANGPLFAAAPELLEAAERIVAATEAGQHFIVAAQHDALKAAIARARSEHASTEDAQL